MPLDDIFYKEEKPILSGAKQLEKRWGITCYITGVLAWIVVTALLGLEEGIDLGLIWTSICWMFLLPFVIPVVASLLSQLLGFIPYKDFSKEERINIYCYIITSLAYVALALFCLHAIFFDGLLDNYLDKLEH